MKYPWASYGRHQNQDCQKRSIESELEAMLKSDAFLDSLRSKIEAELFDLLPGSSNSDCPPILAQAVAHAVKSGGKRVRPALCLMAAEACGGEALGAVAWEPDGGGTGVGRVVDRAGGDDGRGA